MENLKDVSIFSHEGLMEVRKTEYRYEAREISERREVNKKRAVTYAMLREMHAHDWRPVMLAGGVEWNNDYTVEGRRRIRNHWTGLLDRAMAFIAGLAMYNWGLRVSEAAKTVTDKVMMSGGKGCQPSCGVQKPT